MWRDISTATRHGVEILCFAPGNKKAHNANARVDQWRVDYIRDGSFYKMYPESPYTHWMPLPAKPTE